MDPFLLWLEATSLSTWVREATTVFAFPAILSCHTVGMGLSAGINAALAIRILGAARGIPIHEMKRFFPVMWFGFWLNFVSGVVLLIAYPTKALTNPLFYLKLTLVAIAVALVRPITRRVFRDPTPNHDVTAGRRVKTLAIASLACWAGVITSGRLLAYTYTRLMQGL
jgi:hypothetical protein